MALMAPIIGFGFWPAIIALVAYGLLPVVRNTIAGLEAVDDFVIDSARGMGMTPAQILFRIELPIASRIIMNLAVNACAAMPDGGRLVIATSRPGMAPTVEPAADDAAWIQLEVRDTRPNVATAVLDRFFEPFNESAVPPGMGLAAAHGLVTLSNGHIQVAAQQDGGLVLSVLFRAASAHGGETRSDG